MFLLSMLAAPVTNPQSDVQESTLGNPAYSQDSKEESDLTSKYMYPLYHIDIINHLTLKLFWSFV